MKIIFSDYALMQLEKIYYFLQNQNVNAAIHIHNHILDEIEELKNFPKMAAIEPELLGFSHIYRSLVVRKRYKVVYYIERNIIHISAVFDCRQNPRKLHDIIKL